MSYHFHYLHLGSLFATTDGISLKGEFILSDDSPAVLVPNVSDHVHVGSPHLKLSLPVDDGGQRSADQEGAFGVALQPQHAQSRVALPRFWCWCCKVIGHLLIHFHMCKSGKAALNCQVAKTFSVAKINHKLSYPAFRIEFLTLNSSPSDGQSFCLSHVWNPVSLLNERRREDLTKYKSVQHSRCLSGTGWNAHRLHHSHLLVEWVEKDDCLNCLAQTHLIGQDGVGGLSPGEPQPVQSLQLVGVQSAASAVQVIGLPIKLDGGLRRRQASGIVTKHPPWFVAVTVIV